MSRIPDSTQVPVTWKQPHQKEQEHMSEVAAWGHVIGMTREKVAQVAGDLQNLENQRKQRLADQGQRINLEMQGRYLDVYA